MSTAQNAAFEQLLAGWRQHEDLRQAGATISELADSRQALDARRQLAAAAR